MTPGPPTDDEPYTVRRREEIHNAIRRWREENPELVTAFAELREEYRQRFRNEAA